MEVVLQSRGSNGMAASPGAEQQEEEAGLRRGPWTVDEDLTLINYIADHGEGRWNSLARGAGSYAHRCFHPPGSGHACSIVHRFTLSSKLIIYISCLHTGLKRTGKSCRLRWLNYLRPDVKRGNFTADEQLLILDLHSRWGNR